MSPEEALLQPTQEYWDSKGMGHLDAQEFAETVKQTTIQKLDDSSTNLHKPKAKALFKVKAEQVDPAMPSASTAPASQEVPGRRCGAGDGRVGPKMTLSSLWSALAKLKEKINGGSTSLPESSDTPIPQSIRMAFLKKLVIAPFNFKAAINT